jgi:M6 family metalloprotease-like protein
MWHPVVLATLAGALLGAAGPWASPAAAQDIEMASKVHGVPLPEAYWAAVRDIPGAFEIARGWMPRTEAARQTGAAVEGNLPILVIQVLFSDSPEPHVSVAEIERALFTGPAEHGTLTDYYLEVSGGRLEVTGEVLPWLRTEVSLSEAVGTSYGLAGDAELGEALWAALEAADTLVDFARFDNDGPDGIPNSGDDDGFVDVVAFQFIEVAASCGGPGVWPHRWRISGWKGAPFESRARRPDGSPIRVDDYIMQSAVVCSGEEVQTAAVIAHELGHVLGLPDLYDRAEGILPEERRWIVGCWGLMAAGSWGCGDPSARSDAVMPTHMTPWSKAQLGWIQPRTVQPGIDREVSLEPVRTSGEYLRVRLSSTSYLHVEYRTREGFDRDIPASGIMVYHVDNAKPIRRSSAADPLELRVMVLEGDGNDSLRRTALEGGNRGEAGDAWGVDGPGLLTGATHPSTRLHGGEASPVTIRDLRVEDGAARFRISTEAIPAVRLFRHLFGTAASPLTEEEKAYLDRIGNGNGVFDIGDVRAYLRDQPTAR